MRRSVHYFYLVQSAVRSVLALVHLSTRSPAHLRFQGRSATSSRHTFTAAPGYNIVSLCGPILLWPHVRADEFLFMDRTFNFNHCVSYRHKTRSSVLHSCSRTHSASRCLSLSPQQKHPRFASVFVLRLLAFSIDTFPLLLLPSVVPDLPLLPFRGVCREWLRRQNLHI